MRGIKEAARNGIRGKKCPRLDKATLGDRLKVTKMLKRPSRFREGLFAI
jgi:hypothetical protein